MNILLGNKIIRKATYLFKKLLRGFSREEPLRMFGLPQHKDFDCIEAVYVINLDRQPGRWKTFIREARRLKINKAQSLLDVSHRISAIDGKHFGVTEIHSQVTPTYSLDSQYYVDPDPRLLSMLSEKTVNINMTHEEIAVALSHIKAWEKIVSDKVSYALILEDDVFFEKTFTSQLNRSWTELPKRQENGFRFDILYLSYREVDHGAQKNHFSPNLNRPIRGYWWLSGYVLSFSAAQRLLKLLPVTGPVDLWMNHQFCNFDVYSTPNSIISQRVDLQSDNRYSILPLLSQVGIQSDKTHLMLEKTKGRYPVFGIGFDRRGAEILEVAISILGYRCLNDKWGELSDKIDQLLNDKLPLLFDAYVNTGSVTRAFKQLEKLYPNAVFIMPNTPDKGCTLSSQEYNDITEYFVNKSIKLLLLNIQSEDNWSSLCKFLHCNIPSNPFPKNIAVENIFISPEFIPLSERNTVVLEHDVHPWIVPYERLSAFGILSRKRTYGSCTGIFKTIIDDDFVRFNDSQWTALEGSFPANLAMFCSANAKILPSHGYEMTLMKKISGNKEYSSASLVSNCPYQYGRFEVTMKPAKADGVITAFFLHRNDPWQEIDIEFLGCDTTKVLVNVYFNPGSDGANYNYGNRGTPSLIDLNFDAAKGYHRYAIEWEPHEIRWFVDDELVHVRALWEPTQVPNLPMKVYCSIWPPRSTDLAGILMDSKLPICSRVKNICISTRDSNPERHKSI